jgi:hypothetical protein
MEEKPCKSFIIDYATFMEIYRKYEVSQLLQFAKKLLHLPFVVVHKKPKVG